jgi:hypothetical protein
MERHFGDRVIETRDDAGLSNGAAPTRSAIEPVESQANSARIDVLRNLAGAWEHDDPKGLDEYLDWCRHQRRAMIREQDE